MAPSRTRFALHLAQRTIAEFLDDRCPQFAAAIAYRVLFSLFPLAIVAAAIFGVVVRLTGARADAVDAIVSNVPLSDSGADSMRRLLEGATSGLSTIGVVGVVGLVWAASGMMAALRSALNDAWDVTEARPFLKGKLIDVALVGAASLGALASLGVTVAVRFAPRGGGWLLAVVVPLVYAFAVVFLLYRFLPPVRVESRHAWPPALGVACAFVLVQNLFALYVQNFADYNAVYGSLGAVIAFMLFVYLSSWLLLLGAELTSEWPRAVEAFARGEVEEGAPFSVQVRQLLRGLWVRERQREAGE